MCISASAVGFSAWKGGDPASISYITTPML
jgi:hypothetical protein